MPRALTLALTLSLLACGDKDDTDTGDTGGAADTSADTSAGADVFAGQCATCHGPSGNDGSATDLTVAVPALSDAALETVITDGQGYMPPQDLTADELADTIAYLRVTFP